MLRKSKVLFYQNNATVKAYCCRNFREHNLELCVTLTLAAQLIFLGTASYYNKIYPQRNRLFPLLATVYAFRFVGEWMKWLYLDVTKRLEAKDFSTLAKAHACTTGLKSLTTSMTADALKIVVRFVVFIPELFAAYVPACTYEGDNIVLLLQVARFLMKTVQQLRSKRPVGTAAYLGKLEYLLENNYIVSKAEDWMKPSVVLEAFEARSVRLAANCALQVSQASSPEAGFSELSSELVNAAKAHCQLIVVSKFIEKDILRNLWCRVLATH